jgi:copper chaperone CopZ
MRTCPLALVAFVSVLVLAACGAERTEPAAAPAETIEIAVSGMHCAGCEGAIGDAVGRLPGVEEVEASFEAQRARVVYRPDRVTRDEIEQAIESVGYKIVREAGEPSPPAES